MFTPKDLLKKSVKKENVDEAVLEECAKIVKTKTNNHSLPSLPYKQEKWLATLGK